MNEYTTFINLVKTKNKVDTEFKNEYQRRRRLNIKRRVLSKINGGKQPCCGCCGETTLAFLTIDHVQNDGSEERKNLKAIYNSTSNGLIYRKLSKLRYIDKKEYRVLCWNCNCGRAVNGGECPHEEEKRIKKLIAS